MVVALEHGQISAARWRSNSLRMVTVVVVLEWRLVEQREGTLRVPSSVVALILISVTATLVAALVLLVAAFLVCE